VCISQFILEDDGIVNPTDDKSIVQKKTKGLLLKNIVGTVKKSYAQNALKGIYRGRHLNLIM
jgi:hypothetical protein